MVVVNSFRLHVLFQENMEIIQYKTKAIKETVMDKLDEIIIIIIIIIYKKVKVSTWALVHSGRGRRGGLFWLGTLTFPIFEFQKLT
jgi:hypothetical protein